MLTRLQVYYNTKFGSGIHILAHKWFPQGMILGGTPDVEVFLDDITVTLDLRNMEAFTEFCVNHDPLEFIFMDQVVSITRTSDILVTFITPFNIATLNLMNDVASLKSPLPDSVTFACSWLQCVHQDCTVSINGTIQESELTLNQSIIIKESTTVIKNTTIILNPKEGNPGIIADNGTVILDSSTLIYKIEDKEMFDAIQDGQTIVIIEAINNGSIQGQFDEVILDLSNDIEDCRNITAQIKSE